MFSLNGVGLVIVGEEHGGGWERAWESSLELKKGYLCVLGAEERQFYCLGLGHSFLH